ncbi:TPA: hypothetical protein SL557_000015 [Pseudomonas aeruginosa]|nr:hypothetical protein [Pseudomonas aeruginosa]
MQLQKCPDETHAVSPHEAYSSLACLSPFSGIESSLCMVVATFLATALILADTLQPVIGEGGALIVILVASWIVERALRPLVLWVLGRNVYRSIMRMGGKRAADEVVRIYSEGGALNRSQFDALLIRAGKPNCGD